MTPGAADHEVFGRQPLGALFAAPYALFLAVIFAYPLGLAVWISFHDYFFAAPGAQVDRPFVGLENYAAVLRDPDVQRSFFNVAVFLVINVPLTVVLSLVLATGLNSVPGHARSCGSYYVPYVTASVALVGVWLFLFSSGGLVNQSSARWRRTVVAGQQHAGDAGDRPFVTWKSSASSSCSTWPRCRTCSKELYEAAAVDGATSAAS